MDVSKLTKYQLVAELKKYKKSQTSQNKPELAEQLRDFLARQAAGESVLKDAFAIGTVDGTAAQASDAIRASLDASETVSLPQLVTGNALEMMTYPAQLKCSAVTIACLQKLSAVHGELVLRPDEKLDQLLNPVKELIDILVDTAHQLQPLTTSHSTNYRNLMYAVHAEVAGFEVEAGHPALEWLYSFLGAKQSAAKADANGARTGTLSASRNGGAMVPGEDDQEDGSENAYLRSTEDDTLSTARTDAAVNLPTDQSIKDLLLSNGGYMPYDDFDVELGLAELPAMQSMRVYDEIADRGLIAMEISEDGDVIVRLRAARDELNEEMIDAPAMQEHVGGSTEAIIEQPQLSLEVRCIEDGVFEFLRSWKINFPEPEIGFWPNDFSKGERKIMRRFVMPYFDANPDELLSEDIDDARIENAVTTILADPNFPMRKAQNRACVQQVVKLVRAEILKEAERQAERKAGTTAKKRTATDMESASEADE